MSMLFNPDNRVVQLCARGMEMEGQGRPDEAARLFDEAWNLAANDFEKFTAAHYVARHQPRVEEKLNWDKTALYHALQINDDSAKPFLPSLLLNIGKCYEDLNDLSNAHVAYTKALSFIAFLPEGGYGEMIKAGIENGLRR